MTDPVHKSVPDNTAAPTPGRRKDGPTETFPFLIRFVNLVDCPPEGVRYEVVVDKKTVAKCKVGATESEAAFEVREGALITLMVQAIGDTALRILQTFPATSANPVALARVRSVRFASETTPHPKQSNERPVGPTEQALRIAANKPRTDQGISNLPSKDVHNTAEHHLFSSRCACNRDLSLDELVAIFPTRRKDGLQPYLDPINRMFSTYEIQTCLRKAHALAQIGHESGSLRHCAEKLPAGTTEERKYDGYKGRGLIQLTGEEMYRKYGQYKGANFLGENRVKLETHEYAVDSAGWFWNFGKPYRLSEYADVNDLIFVTAVINAGFNGFDDRAKIFTKAHTILNAQNCADPRHRSSAYLSFDKSKANDNRDMAFAWGLWSDPQSEQKGLCKNHENSKAGYRRFLELNDSKPVTRTRFRIPPEQMIKIAEERSK